IRANSWLRAAPRCNHFWRVRTCNSDIALFGDVSNCEAEHPECSDVIQAHAGKPRRAGLVDQPPHPCGESELARSVPRVNDPLAGRRACMRVTRASEPIELTDQHVHSERAKAQKFGA